MSELINMIPDENDQGHWNVNDHNLFDLLKLLVKVVPVAYVYRCEDCNGQTRLIIITDQHQYQDSDQTRLL